MSDQAYLEVAYQEALKAFEKNEVPVGAIVVQNNTIIGRGFNLKESLQKATAHAEIVALESAMEATKSWRLEECTLYSTLEPCPMCAGALLQSRIKRLVFGAKDLKWGAAGTVLNLFEIPFNHPIKISYLETPQCATILSAFFKNLRHMS